MDGLKNDRFWFWLSGEQLPLQLSMIVRACLNFHGWQNSGSSLGIAMPGPSPDVILKCMGCVF